MLADSDRSDAGPTGRPDCVITVLPGGQAGLGPAEYRALRVLAEAGLIPPLRSPTQAPAQARPRLRPRTQPRPQPRPRHPSTVTEVTRVPRLPRVRAYAESTPGRE